MVQAVPVYSLFMTESDEELLTEFKEYLQRFDTIAGGESEFGAFVKFNGRLTKKMRFEEFGPVYGEYMNVARAYFDSLDRGDPINDIVVRMLRDHAHTLIKNSPV